jgi:hypothetical protein
LVSAGLNEHDILMAFKIFKIDLCNSMPYGDRTYLERLSEDLNKYPTVRDTLTGLNDKILIKKSHIDKLAVDKSNLEAFLFLLVITIYFYSMLLNLQQVQIQKNLIKRIRLVCVFNYLLPLFFTVMKEPKKSVRPKFVQNKIEQQQQQKTERERKNCKKKTKIKKINKE